MFSTGGSTLSVDKIKPGETRACYRILTCIEREARQVVHIENGAPCIPECHSAPAEVNVAHFLLTSRSCPSDS